MHHHLTFAIDEKTNRMVGIDDVANGLQCGCLCPHCKQRLIAKNGGTDRAHHFAHNNGQECEGARMTALHLLTQQIIEEQKTLMLPDYQEKYYKKSFDKITFEEVVLEKKINIQDSYLRPDCIGIKYGKDNSRHQLWIEILVTHKVNSEKRKKIRDLKAACIEINLSDMLITDFSPDSIRHRLFENKKDRKWINCPICDEKNRQLKIKHEQEESERVRREEAQKRWLEELQIKEEEEELTDKRTKHERVERWFENGNSETAKYFMAEIKSKPFLKNSTDIFSKLPNYLYNELIPNDDFLSYINASPKNNEGLQLFYTLLHYYYYKVTCINFSKVKEQLKKYQYQKTPLTAEEKIHLEELISLRTIYFLENNCWKHASIDNKPAIKNFISDKKIRSEVLMVSSVLYHHIIGSNAQSFGELTKEIIQLHPNLTKSYLSIIRCQDKYPNNYYLNNCNMLDELIKFVNYKQIYPNETTERILRECYNFAFMHERQKPSNNNHIPKEDYNEKAWKELNEMYKKA